MNGIDLTISAIVMAGIQFLVGISQVLRYFLKARDTKLLKYAILTFLFVLYNLSIGLSQSINVVLTQLIGVALTSYYFYFICSQILNIRTRSTKLLVISASFVVTTLLSLNLWISDAVKIEESLTNFYPVLMITYFSFGAIGSVYGKWTSGKGNKIILYTGLSAFLYLIISTTSFIIGNSGLLYTSTVNIFFLIALHDYTFGTINKPKSDFVLIERITLLDRFVDVSERLKKHGLSEKEMKVALQILRGDSYQTIADNSGIKLSTVNKHASNIFGKTNSDNRHGFIIKFTT